ncbi:MAG: hypothetical protein HY924_00070 [Elusimicrobia bacterium]|nr:hypothetical protein [Elusimicrobiota bacterium]
MRKTGLSLALAALALLPAEARAAYQVTQVDESDLTGPCFVNGQACVSAKTGTVLQIFGGESLHVYKKGDAYQVDSYRAAEPFRAEALLGSKPFRTIEELNRHLSGQGFKKLGEGELTAENQLDRRRTGVVLERLTGVDMLLRKEGGSYSAVHYEFTRIFVKDAKRETFSFKTLDEVNDHVLKTARRFRSASSF